MQITHEARLVAWCAREPDAVSDAHLRAAADAVRDWRLVERIAAAHRVSGYVQDALARAGCAVPESSRERLRGSTLAALAQGMLLEAALKRIDGTFRADAIPVMVLKGPSLARTIYPSPLLRPFGDLDLTVAASHELHAVVALHRLGYAEIDYEAEDARRAHAGHVHEGAAFHRQFRSPSSGALVELHLDPLQLGLRPTCEAARWRRAVPVPGLAGAVMLGPEDQVVQLSVHAHKHGYSRLIWLKDLDLLMRTFGEKLDWELIRAVARREGVQASVWYSLRLARGMLTAPLPADALARLRPSWPVRVAYEMIWPRTRIAGLRGHMRRRAVQFHAAESWRGMLPSLMLMGRRRERARAAARMWLGR